MTNRQIRRQAYRVYRDSFRVFIGVAALAAIPAILGLVLNIFIEPQFRQISSLLMGIAGYPLVLGTVRFFFKSFHGESSFVSEIFYYYKAARLAGALFLGAAITALNFASAQLNTFLRELTQIDIRFFFMHLPYFALATWIYFRLFLVPYVYIGNHTATKNPLVTIKESFRQMKGYFIDIAIFSVTVYFIPVLVLVPVFIFVVSAVGSWFVSINLLASVFWFLSIPFAPYIGLSFAGFAAGLLLPPAPKRKIKKPIQGSYRYNKKKYRYKTDWFD